MVGSVGVDFFFSRNSSVITDDWSPFKQKLFIYILLDKGLVSFIIFSSLEGLFTNWSSYKLY